MFLLATALTSLVSALPEPAPAATGRLPIPLALTVGYFGDNIFHPGLKLGTEATLLQLGGFSVFGAADAGGYVHYRYASALLAEAGLGGRYTAWKGLFADLRACAGYLHLIPSGEVYRISADGTVESAPNLGKPAFRPAASLGLGWDASAVNVAPALFFLGLETAGELAMDSPPIFHPGLMLGAAFKL